MANFAISAELGTFDDFKLMLTQGQNQQGKPEKKTAGMTKAEVQKQVEKADKLLKGFNPTVKGVRRNGG